MAKKPLPDHAPYPNNYEYYGYAPVEELKALRDKLEFRHLEDEEIIQVTAAIEAKDEEVRNRIQPIADEFNFPNIDSLIDVIHQAYKVPEMHRRDKLLKRNHGDLIEALVTCCKETQSVIFKLGLIEKSLLSSCYDGGKIDDLITSMSVEAGVAGKVAINALAQLPEVAKLSKKTPYWWFVRILADFWKAEIKEKPTCSFSIAINDGDGSYTGNFYKFVTACTQLDRKQLGVGISNGSTIKNILKEWSVSNPM